MLYTAVNYKKGPIALRYPRGSALGVPLKDGFTLIEIGKSERLKEGDDVVFLAIGSMVNYSLKAAEKLEAKGISCEIINMRFAKPLDTERLDDISERYSKVVTLEENVLTGGFGSAVIEYFNDKNYKNFVLRIGLPDSFIDHGTQEELHNLLGIDPDGIANKVITFCKNPSINQEVPV